MDKREMKQQIINRMMELKAQEQMNRFVFSELAKENYRDSRIDELLDLTDEMKREFERLEKLLKELD